MSDVARRSGHPISVVLYCILGVALVAQLALLFLLPTGRVEWLQIVGWGVFALSAVFGWVPIFVFRRHGGVAKGRTYIHTTQLVTSGLYAIVRHPQFLAGDLIAVAVMCITQHWAALVTGAAAIVSNRLTMIKADRDLVAKFGEPYREYMARVPGASLVVGLWRRAHRLRRRR
jgi:protein-S-isoprenylcysteine O-methyltransferase Ste14